MGSARERRSSNTTFARTGWATTSTYSMRPHYHGHGYGHGYGRGYSYGYSQDYSYGLNRGYGYEYGDAELVTEDEVGGGAEEEQRLPCGLLPSQVAELLFRDLTPEDYDVLLLLDEGLDSPHAAASPESIQKCLMRPACAEACVGETCTICLLPIEEVNGSGSGSGDIAQLPCKHVFHHDCISKWLLKRRCTCPLCGVSTSPTAAPEENEDVRTCDPK